MWLAVLTAVSLTARVVSQHSYVNQKLQQSGTALQWGWQLSPLDATVQLDQYYVQPLQHFQFTDVGVYPSFGTLPSGTQASAVGYDSEVPNQLHHNPINNSHTQNNLVQGNVNSPVDLYYVPQQYPGPELQTLQSAPGNLIQYNTPQNSLKSNTVPLAGYDIQTEHPLNVEGKAFQQSTSKLQEEEKESISPIVQVFKDHNCSDESKTPREYSSNLEKTQELSVELPSYDENDDSGLIFSKDKSSIKSSQATSESKKDRTRGNTNNEGYYYYTTEVSIEAQRRDEEEGISRLVASTQDLISNDDLLRINHAIEKHVYDIGDDHIKPLRQNSRIERNGNLLGNHITLSAKITNIENKSDNSDQEQSQQEVQEGKFTSPIVVEDSTDEDLHEKIVDTLVSTMSPYLDDGYQIVSVTQQNDTKTYVPYYNGETVHVTPRPVGQKYLAPITVALRLLNSNHSETFNSIDDHDTSDTEFIEKTVKSPPKEKTIVEIQQSIPVDITHINEVEVHEYMEEGRSNPNPFDAARNLFNKYMRVLEAERQNEENRNRALESYNSKESDVNKEEDSDGAKDKLEASENVRSDVRVNYNDDYNNKYTKNYYDKNSNNGKVIQPIVIEKEIQIPQFIDRYIEKPVPYPEPVEVVKHVPVDRPFPVAVPYEKVVEKPVEVTKYVDKPFPVPYPVHHKVYVDRPIHVPYPVEKIVEKEVVKTVPVPTPVAVPVKVPFEKPVLYPVEVEKPVPVERVVEKEVPVPYPVPYEKKVPVTVERIVEKPVPVHIPVHIYKPVDRIVEKKVPYIVPVDRVVEKKVQVRIPYPIEKVVEKVVEKPVIVTKYIDKPYPVETRVPYLVNKFPYQIEAPYSNRAYYNDGTKQESQNRPHYLQYQKQAAHDSLHKEQTYPKQNVNLYYQGPNNILVQTTQWGNSYASTFTYINGTDNNKAVPSNNLEYVTRNDYYGPPPMQTYDSMWEKNVHISQDNLKRNDRTAKVANLRIEYGGFKPPLIPSTEVDLDGRPINKEEER